MRSHNSNNDNGNNNIIQSDNGALVTFKCLVQSLNLLKAISIHLKQNYDTEKTKIYPDAILRKKKKKNDEKLITQSQNKKKPN